MEVILGAQIDFVFWIIGKDNLWEMHLRFCLVWASHSCNLHITPPNNYNSTYACRDNRDVLIFCYFHEFMEHFNNFSSYISCVHTILQFWRCNEAQKDGETSLWRVEDLSDFHQPSKTLAVFHFSIFLSLMELSNLIFFSLVNYNSFRDTIKVHLQPSSEH